MYVIGISGGVASGKTTLAKQISSMFDNVTVLSLDNYFYPYSELSLEERKKKLILKIGEKIRVRRYGKKSCNER